jgi:drug/metabolite transporter (DMT)-like permease
MLRFLLSMVIAGALGYAAYMTANRRARLSRRRRRLLLAGNAVAVVLGLLLAVWLPTRVPETSGSPASLVAILVLWMVGGSLAFLGVAALLGAFFARTAPVEPAATQPVSK